MKNRYPLKHSRRVAQAIALLGILVLIGRSEASPEIPGKPQTKPIALVGGTVHTVSGAVIQGGTVVFDQGKIVAVGKNVKIPTSAKKIDVTGKHVYPGLIDAYTDMGLTEVNAVRSTRDVQEVGQINPNVKAQVAFNPDSELIPVGRAGGVLTTLTVPRGGLISGQAAMMYLDGWTWEDMALRPGVAMHVVWPRMTPVSAWWAKDSKKDQLKERDKSLELLTKTIADARAYQKAKQAGADQKFDTRLNAMLPVLSGKQPLLVAADGIGQIQAAVAFTQQEKLKLIIVGGYDAPHCAELLKKYNVPVVVAGVHRLPRRRSEPYDEPFTVPARLHKAGITYCISGGGRFGAPNVRNLPYHAGTAAAFGLSRDEALKAITLHAAKIFGVDDRIGSLEKGKDATILVTTGDILETPSNVVRAYIRGSEVNLSSRHTRLWEKYKEKYRRRSVK